MHSVVTIIAAITFKSSERICGQNHHIKSGLAHHLQWDYWINKYH